MNRRQQLTEYLLIAILLLFALYQVGLLFLFWSQEGFTFFRWEFEEWVWTNGYAWPFGALLVGTLLIYIPLILWERRR